MKNETKVFSRNVMQWSFAKKMPGASDNGSQPYSRAYGYGEMAGQSDTTPKTLPLGKGQGLTMSPTIKGGNIIVGNTLPAISQPPRGAAVWLATIV